MCGGGGGGGGKIPGEKKKRTFRETGQFSSILLYVHRGLLGTGNPRMATSTFTQLLSSEDRKRESLKVYHQHKCFLLRSPTCVSLQCYVRPERVGSQREANVLRPQFDGHGVFLRDG